MIWTESIFRRWRGRLRTLAHRASTGARRIAMVLLLAIIAPMVPQVAWSASFQVSPTRFEFKLNKRFTDSFTVTNNSQKRLRLRVFTSFLDVDDSNKLVPVKNHQLDLSKYVVINPRKFVLRPGQKRVVRFSVRRPPASLAPGEYRVVVFFAELPIFSGKKAPPPKPSTQGGIGRVRIELLTRLGITMYGMKGKPNLKAVLERAKVSLESDRVVVEGRAINKGNVRIPLTLNATLADLTGKTWKSVHGKIVVQRQQWREFRLMLPRPPRGQYRIHLSGSSGKTVLFQSSLRFDTLGSSQ